MRDRRTNMHDRLGLFTGGMEKLGFMPVLLALYLQLKDWRFGDWTVLSKITQSRVCWPSRYCLPLRCHGTSFVYVYACSLTSNCWLRLIVKTAPPTSR